MAGELVWQQLEGEDENEASLSPYKAQAIFQFSQKAFAVAEWADKEAPQSQLTFHQSVASVITLALEIFIGHARPEVMLHSG